MKGLFTAFRLGREIKNHDKLVTTLKQEINELKTKLDVFVHDPYIKKEMEKPVAKETVEQAPSADPENQVTHKEDEPKKQ